MVVINHSFPSPQMMALLYAALWLTLFIHRLVGVSTCPSNGNDHDLKMGGRSLSLLFSLFPPLPSTKNTPSNAVASLLYTNARHY